MSKERKFDYSQFPPGFYHDVVERGNPVRAAWHLQKFRRVISCLPDRPGQSILDIGCFAGTFLSMLGSTRFSKQVGIDILPAQIDYAMSRFGTDYRQFQKVLSVSAIDFPKGYFDCVTLIEVIEHLEKQEAGIILEKISAVTKPGGKLILTTPNYASAWPAIELLINRFSDVSYKEQHVTKFNFFTAVKKIATLNPDFPRHFKVDFVTTTHALAPFLAVFSRRLSDQASAAIDHKYWRFPFGNLILMSFTRL